MRVCLYGAMGKALGYRSGSQWFESSHVILRYALLTNNPNKLESTFVVVGLFIK